MGIQCTNDNDKKIDIQTEERPKNDKMWNKS